MEKNMMRGSVLLTLCVGFPVCMIGLQSGLAGLLSAVIFTIGFGSWMWAIAVCGSPGVGMASIVVIAFQVFLLFCVSALLFGQEVTIQAASYWKGPIAFGGIPTDNLLAGLGGDRGRLWIGIFQLCIGAACLIVLWRLIHAFSNL